MLGKILRMFGGPDIHTSQEVAAPAELPTIRPPAVLQSVIEPTPIAQPGPRHDGTPVPYYPRKGPAVPAASPAKLLATQDELIRELRQASALSFDEFDRFIRPVIDLYAAFVHLLPASEYDHHSDLGGLFRHGLEVALNASRRAEGKEFALNEDPCVRKFQIFRWRACALLGGMLHDLGKAVIDVGAIDETGDHVWNPHVQPLWDWICEKQLEHYTIAWRQGRRHREHDAISATAVARILPDETMRWMGEYRGRAAYDAMLMALTGANDPNNPLSDLIKKADIDSVLSDRAASQRRLASIGAAGSRGNAVLLVRAMRERILQGEWRVNELHHPIWHTTDGLYAMYPQSAKEAIEHLRNVSGVTSIPNEPPIVVDVLRESGIISEGMGPGGKPFSIHRIKVHAPDKNGGTAIIDIQAIKFANEYIIPDYFALPPPVEVELLDPDGKPRAGGGGTVQPYAAETPAAPVPAKAAATAPADSSKGRKAARAAAAIPAAAEPRSPSPAPTPAPAPASTTSTAAPLHHHDDIFLSDEEDLEPTPLPDEGAPFLDPVAMADPSSTPLRDWASERDPRDALIIEHQQIDRDPFPPTSAAGAKSWLDKQDNGIYLSHVIERAEAGELRWEQHLFEREGYLHILFPEAFDGCGNEPSVLRDAFLRDEWIEPDPARPTRATVPLTVGKDQVVCLRFSHGVSLALTLLLPAKPKPETRARELGPYIVGSMARLYSGTAAKQGSDAPIIRLAFHNYLSERYTEPDVGWSQAAPTKLRGDALAFAKQNKIEGSLVRRLLKHGNNPLLLPLPELDFSPNPSYSREADEAAFTALEREDAGATTP